MASGKAFFDTNVLLYLLSADTVKADVAEGIMVNGGVISAQVLNEFASVAQRKMGMSFLEIREVLAPIHRICDVAHLTLDTHIHGLRIAERYKYNVWDAMIVASALLADCAVLYTEDMRHGQIFEDRLQLINPFLRADG
ncbi:PIN domain-containing protein [Acidithiobacillus ferrooxidans]|jgi:predicted nucleic acid-binding protein|uniref:PIN domain-containing protein n=1 Tax=Acidithiobacillus ferrooxidans TaxID=920 RepID=UPI001C069D1C|nr:PIN domain-containing protein [Acidithiobacillus ferrooxidans]MBU2806711.1 PIN domain-containing protein [Acidithiobacillus ferrooxidans F221]UBU62057.1 PIN domain-containing protein [Acidithiobacillus ferrooxidans]